MKASLKVRCCKVLQTSEGTFFIFECVHPGTHADPRESQRPGPPQKTHIQMSKTKSSHSTRLEPVAERPKVKGDQRKPKRCSWVSSQSNQAQPCLYLKEWRDEAKDTQLLAYHFGWPSMGSFNLRRQPYKNPKLTPHQPESTLNLCMHMRVHVYAYASVDVHGHVCVCSVTVCMRI